MTEPRPQCTRTEQAVGWALHALEPDEEMDVERHVPTCPDCRAAVRDTEAVMTHLATAVEQVDPPPRLRASILDAAAATPQVPAPPREPVAAPSPRHPRTASAVRSAALRPGLVRAEKGSTVAPRLIAAAAAVVAVVAIGGLGLRTFQLQQQLDSVTAQASTATDLVRELARPGVSHALLARPDGTAVAAVVLSGGQRDVYTLGLAANATDHTYVLWGLKDMSSAPQPLGAFDVTARDPGLRVVGESGQDAYAAYAISLEPGRTPPAAPTDVVAAGNLEA